MNELEKSKFAIWQSKKGSKFDSSPSSAPWVSESIWHKKKIFRGDSDWKMAVLLQVHLDSTITYIAHRNKNSILQKQVRLLSLTLDSS